MTCLACKHGQLKVGHTTVTVERENTTVLIRGVPADVCETCGEAYLDAAVAVSVEAALEDATVRGVRFEVREDLTA